MNRLWVTLSITTVMALFIGCGSSAPKLTPEDPHWRDNDARPIPKPEESSESIAWDAVRRGTFNQIQQLLDVDRSTRIIFGNRQESWNINSYDEVPNSSWFTNRHYFTPLSRKKMMSGAGTAPPDTTGTWVVSRPKVGGVTPGFWITDPKGDTYILKFDRIGFPELATGAAAIAGRVFHAAGYFVAEEHISYFHRDSLEIKEGLTYKVDGERVLFTTETLDGILARVQASSDGYYRVLASKLIPNVMGPWSFTGTRSDDPNDWCPAENRREIRALKILCAWLNHWDIKDANTINSFVGNDDTGYVRHYLLDFGTVMGTVSDRPYGRRRGYHNYFDLKDIFLTSLSLGLYVWPWEKIGPITYPEIGYFESEQFNPKRWKPGYPIPPFENMTHRDAFWGAKLVMAFRDDDLEALVDAAYFTRPEVRTEMLRILRERRDKIGRAYLGATSTLDRFAISDDGNGSLVVSWDDLLQDWGLVTSGETRGEVRFDGNIITVLPRTREQQITVPSETVSAMQTAWDAKRTNPDASPLFRLRLTTERSESNWATHHVDLWLWYHDDDNKWQLVGVQRHD